MRATEFAGNSILSTVDFLNLTIGDIDDDQYNWQPPGTCNTIAKLHIHAASGVDFFVNGMLSGQPPVWAAHAAKLGVPVSPAELWPSGMRIPRAGIDAYVKEMRESVKERLAALSDDALTRSVQTPMAGAQTGEWVLQLGTMHTAGHAGEISAIEGVQGLKGLPF
jgi:hypothetical protein